MIYGKGHAEDPDFQRALAYLERLRRLGSRPGLERIRELLQLAGNPERDYEIIHVTGTNGKGSVTSMIASILKAAGYRVGMFTSPYLETVTESIKVDGEDISPRDYARVVSELAPLAARVGERLQSLRVDETQPARDRAGLPADIPLPTEFEFLTAAAFYFFSRKQIDLAVVEVGLGGASDATNVIPAPLAAVITNVGYDHMNLLGDSLRVIAQEKAGIIKRGSLVITAAQDPEVLAVLKREVIKKGCDLFQVGRDLTWTEKEYSRGGQVIEIRGPWRDLDGLRINLLGRHQQINAATAIMTLEALAQQGLRIPEEAIRQGLASVSWPGRFEVFPGSPTLILDGAHNRDGALVLKRALEDTFPGLKATIVLSVLKDKEVGQILDILSPLAGKVIATQSKNPRVLPAQALAEAVKGRGVAVEVIGEAAEALERAQAICGPEELVLVTGSLYLLGEIYGPASKRRLSEVTKERGR